MTNSIRSGEAEDLYQSRDELSTVEQKELDAVNDRLDLLGFRFVYPDDEYSRYLRLRSAELEQLYHTRDRTAS